MTEEDLSNLVNQKLSELKASEATPENEERKKISNFYPKNVKIFYFLR